MFSAENLTNLSTFRKSICLHSHVPYLVHGLIYNRVMKKENKGTEPKKVGYLKYLRLQKKELGEKHTIDDYFCFSREISAGRTSVFSAASDLQQDRSL